MLLEQLVEQAAQPPGYDWDSYYCWLFSQLAGREVTDFKYWLCKKCLTVNSVYLPARYGKCRSCGLIHLPDEMGESESKTGGAAVQLDIHLFAGLKCANTQLPCHGEKEFSHEFPDGITIRQLRDLLGIDPTIPLLVMVNNRGAQEDLVLTNGDRVALFPPIGGG